MIKKFISTWLNKKRILVSALIFSMFILVLAVYWIWAQNKLLERDYHDQYQASIQQEKFDDLLLNIQFVNSAVRRYSTDHDKKYFSPHKTIIDSIKSKYEELRSNQGSSINSINTALFTEYDNLIRQHMLFTEQVMRLSEKDKFDTAFARIALLTAIKLNDSILLMKDKTNSYFRESNQKFQTVFVSLNKKNDNLAYLVIFASMIFIPVVFHFLVKEIKRATKITEELRQQKDFMRVTLNSLGEGLITTGKDGNIIYMNPVAEKLTGWKTHEVVNKPLQSVYNIVHEETGLPLENIVSRILRGDKSEISENNTILRSKTDDIYLISNTGSKLLDMKGDLLGSVLVFKDITERRERELLIKNAVKKYRNLFEQASDAIITYTFDGKIHEFNEIICDLSGYTKAEFAQLKLTDILVGELIMSVEKYEAILAGQSVTLNRQFKRKDGKLVEMEIKTKMLDDGKILGIGRDITTRIRNETKIREAIERYEILSKATSDTIWDWDIKKDSILYNDGITKMFGYDLQEVDNMADWWKNNIHPEDKNIVTRLLDIVFKGKRETIQMEYRYRCADHSYKYILDRAFVLYDNAGLPVRMIGAMQDISKEKEHERHLSIAIIEAQEKERKELGMELHDNVNQLLSATLLYLGIAKKAADDGKNNDESLNECVNLVSNAINDIRNLTHRLTPYTREKVTLKQVVEWLTEPMQKANQFEIDLQIDDFEYSMINADIQTNLYRIIQEQLTNILKHADANKIEIVVQLTDHLIKLKITDNGVGFDPALATTGIGLQNIRRRAEMFSGVFTLNAAPGKGCEIKAEIPLI